MAERVVDALSNDFGGAVEVVVNTPGQFEPLLMVTGLGLGLVALRAMFLSACPALAANADLVALFIDSITVRFIFIFKEMSLMKKAIVIGIEAASIAEGDGEIFTDLLIFVNPAAIKHFLTDTPIACQSYGGIGPIWDGIGRLMTGGSLCPHLRYLYPVRWVYEPVVAMVGWLSADPDPTTNNCTPDEPIEAVCVGLGIGYVLLEILLPLIIIALLFPLIKPTAVTVYVAADVAISSVKKTLTEVTLFL
jgi:hypothetical protein